MLPTGPSQRPPSLPNGGDMRAHHGVENCGTRSVIVADERWQSLPSIGKGRRTE
jgi:hypothetical protein